MAQHESSIGVIQFARTLRRRHQVALGVSAVAALASVGLDTIALALLVPTIEFMANLSAGSGEIQAVEWLRSAFDAVGLDFTLRWTLTATLVAMSVRAVLLLVQAWLGSYFMARYEAELKNDAYSAVMHARWQFFLRQRAGALSNMLIMESNRAGLAFGMLNGAVAALLNVLVYVGVAFALSWELTLLTVAATLVLMVGFSGLGRIARRLGVRTSAVNTELGAEINEGLGGAKIIKSEALETSAARRLADIVARRARIDVLIGLNNGVFMSTAELALIGLLLGGLLLATRMMDMPAGTVLLFALLFIRIYQRSRVLQSTVLEINTRLPGAVVVKETTEAAQSAAEEISGKPFTRLERGIQFEDVTFAYGDGKPVLRRVPIEIPAGSMVALAGRSGAGKTSIIDLTIGLLEPTEGRVLVDGEPLESYDKNAWRSKLAYVSQETILFHDSISRNIAWGREETSEAAVFEAARLAQADQFIRALPDGYDTVIGDRGMRLSGGQRQRIALARALLRNPELLILDEATSELDAESEARIQEALEGVRGRTTVLMAAHRLSTITSADRIYVLEDGEIVESGTASELFAMEGAFHRSYHRPHETARTGAGEDLGRGSAQVGK